VTFAGGFGTLPRDHEDWRAIDADDRSCRAGQLAGQAGDVAKTGSKIEDAHAFRDAGTIEEQASRVFVKRGLLIQPLQFGRIAAQYVVGLRHRRQRYGESAPFANCSVQRPSET
jgi:hypothetical protein